VITNQILMSYKKRHRKRSTSKAKKIDSKALMPSSILLTTISCFLLWSVVSYLYSDKDKYKGTPSLEELISSNSYEENTGHKITLEILNGCGQPKAANMYQNFLQHHGYDVGAIDNAKHNNYKHTEIHYHPQDYEDSLIIKTFDMANYLSENTMGINDSLIKNVKRYTSFDLTLIIGDDFKELSSYNEARKYYKKY